MLQHCWCQNCQRYIANVGNTNTANPNASKANLANTNLALPIPMWPCHPVNAVNDNANQYKPTLTLPMLYQCSIPTPSMTMLKELSQPLVTKQLQFTLHIATDCHKRAMHGVTKTAKPTFSTITWCDFHSLVYPSESPPTLTNLICYITEKLSNAHYYITILHYQLSFIIYDVLYFIPVIVQGMISSKQHKNEKNFMVFSYVSNILCETSWTAWKFPMKHNGSYICVMIFAAHLSLSLIMKMSLHSI